MPRTILWFRNDLRLHDNAIVAAAVATVADKGHTVVPIFCFDDRFMSARNVIDQHPHTRKVADPKMGRFRAKFLLESVNDLRSSLQALGSDLFVFYERPEAVIPRVPCLTPAHRPRPRTTQPAAKEHPDGEACA